MLDAGSIPAGGTIYKSIIVHSHPNFFILPMKNSKTEVDRVRGSVPHSSNLRGYKWGYIFLIWGYILVIGTLPRAAPAT